MAADRMNGSLRVAIIAALALATATCGSSPDLRMAGDPGTAVGIGVANVPVDAPVSFGTVMLCVSAPGTAIVRSVAVHEPTGDIEVEVFATRPNPFARGLDGLGTARSTIADLRLDFDPAATPVAGVCPEDVESAPASVSAQIVELAIQVARRSGDAAGGPALDVTYVVDGRTRIAVIPFGVWLCASTCPPEAGDLMQQ
jgi:hypothetical protein